MGGRCQNDITREWWQTKNAIRTIRHGHDTNRTRRRGEPELVESDRVEGNGSHRVGDRAIVIVIAMNYPRGRVLQPFSLLITDYCLPALTMTN